MAENRNYTIAFSERLLCRVPKVSVTRCMEYMEESVHFVNQALLSINVTENGITRKNFSNLH
jgi:hypothetical protein